MGGVKGSEEAKGCKRGQRRAKGSEGEQKWQRGVKGQREVKGQRGAKVILDQVFGSPPPVPTKN